MKQTAFFLVVGLLLSNNSIANIDPHETEACIAVRKVCEIAGFKVGEVNVDNGVWANCFKPLKNGKTVKGIKADKALKKNIKTCAEAGG